MNTYIKGAVSPLGTLFYSGANGTAASWRIGNGDLGGYFASNSSPMGWDVTSTIVTVPLSAATTGTYYQIEF